MALPCTRCLLPVHNGEIESTPTDMAFLNITAQEVYARLQKEEGFLLDVRTPGEFSRLHAASAVNVPLPQLSAATLQQLEAAKGKRIYVLCHSGARAERACALLEQQGLPAQTFRVEGGTAAWAAAGLPVVRGSGVIALDRQVRIAAGSLVLLGFVLSRLVMPEFLYLSVFIGCGLVFSGLSGWCGMAHLLAVMPWNQKANPHS